MTFFIGTDEAGYGPNFGPLLITATAWRFPEGTTAPQCWEMLSDTIGTSLPELPEKLQVADSKKVYSPGRSITSLEKTVLSFLKLLNQIPNDFDSLGTAVAGTSFQYAADRERCRAPERISLPVETDVRLVERLSQRLRESLGSAAAELVTVRSRVIFPAEFNELVKAAGSKGRVLSTETLQLVARIVRDKRPKSAQIICDKHGGRNRYADLISAAFDDGFVFRLEEGRQLSRYRLNDLEFRFQTRAEEHLPVALASMISKYLREVAMLEFNAFWRQIIPGLKPTQGYPVDAARFLEDIEEELHRQNIPKKIIWRCR
ncbi:MAG: hypothetical protein MK102_09610 [Fuerstiella sp.]|nr:hypothetical protein [Fuerstiella sp.]